MLDTLRANQGIGQLLYVGGLAAKDDHLKAVIVVEVDMQSGDNQVLKVVLSLDQLIIQKPDVMIVYHRDCSDHAGCG